MVKIGSLVTTWLFLLVLNTSIASDSISNAEKSNGQTIVIGMSSREKGTNYLSDSERDDFIGGLTSYWNYWGKQNNFNIEFLDDTQENLLLALELGEVDIIALSAFKESRRFKFQYSIPYIEFQGILYKSLNPSTAEPQIALNLPLGVYPNTLNEQLDVAAHNPIISNIITRAHEVDYIYSWNTVDFDEALVRSNHHTKFVKVANDQQILVRAVVKEENFELLEAVNRGIRHIDKEVVDSFFTSEISTQNISYRHLVGSYLTNLTPEQESLVTQTPVMTYAHLIQGEEPYFISQDFYYEGYMTDIMRDLQKSLGVTFKPVAFHSFQDALDAVNSGKINVFPGIYQTDARESTLSFTTHVDSSSLAIVSEQDVYSLEELEGKRIASVRGFYENELVSEKLKNNPVIYVDTAKDAIVAVAEGNADAYIGKLLKSAYIINQEDLHVLDLHKANDFHSQFLPRLALAKHELNWIDLLNLGIFALGEDYQEDMQAYWKRNLFLAEESEKVRKLYKNILVATAFVAIFMLFLFTFHRYQLNKRNNVQQSLERALKEAEQAKREAEDMTLAKSDFLARMSHEIRTPMNGVLGMAEAISFTKLDKEQADLLQTLNGSARNLMALLNDVLDFSKMDAGKLTLESMTCDISTLLTSVIGNFKHKANAKNLEMTSRMDSHLQHAYLCDSTRLMQVLNNLVSNSVKFTQKGYIELSAQLITQEYKVTEDGTRVDLIGFHVRDSGIGVPTDKLNSLFDPFVQADGDITRKFGGTGLGLSICKEIISEMGGDIRVSSVVDHGSLFSITLPLVLDNSNEQMVVTDTQLEENNNEVKELGQLKVLFAEDNEVNRKVIGGQLKRLGVNFDEAENGKIAHEKFLADPTYDIVLSDCHMPEMDGFALAGELSKNRKNNTPYLIAITADALSGAAKRCKDAGFDDYISKPCPMDILESKLRDAAVTTHTDMSDFSQSPNSLTDWLDANSSDNEDGLREENVQGDQQVPVDWLTEEFSGDYNALIDEDLSWLSDFETESVQEDIVLTESDIDAKFQASLSPNMVTSVWDDNEEGAFELLSQGANKQADLISDEAQTIDDPYEDMFETIDQNHDSNTALSEHDQNLLDDLNSFLEATDEDSTENFEDEFEAFLNQGFDDIQSDGLFDVESEASDIALTDLLTELTNHEGEPSSPIPEIEPFDPVHVLAMSGDDEEIAAEILDSFISAYQRDIQELQTVLASADTNHLKDTAHRIKGSALYLGNSALSETAKALEHESAKGSLESAQERVDFICQALQVLGQEVETYRAALGVS
ncbi:ATP-binding protein [Vibrio maerlii]|uniref:ATP-binding protein n=1 Tax=Vibrio maerlii TaxID=2231648 RepID=UPI0013DFA8C2|nr:transporter substrate-binding domain-containing protein [Vibrio maerlii]